MSEISVIVPVYKVEKYLRRCIESILQQTFTEFEVLLVDDGSPDKSPEICDEYRQVDARVHVIHQKNGGLSAARNAGIDWSLKNSNNRWICFIDSDDWIHPKMLEYLYRAVNEQKVQISACGMTICDSYKAYDEMDYNVRKVDALDLYIENDLLAAVACNKLYSKKIFENFRYPIGKLHEDGFLTYKLLYHAKEIAWIDVPLYYYFQHESSITHQYSLERLDQIESIEEQCEFAKKIGATNFYHNRLSVLAEVYRYHYLGLQKLSGTEQIQKEILKKLRHLLRSKRDECQFSVSQNPREYEIAFPRKANLYWKIERIKEILKTEGVMALLQRIIHKIF